MVALKSLNNIQVRPTGAIKADGGKPPLSLIPRRGLYEVARVMGYGAQKYERDNWRKGFPWTDLLSAADRHIWAFLEGETNDQETGYSHLAHAVCELLFVMEYAKTHPELDDRPVKPNEYYYVLDSSGSILPTLREDIIG